MPIYEYQCDECGHLFEEMKKRSAPEPATCPKCGAAEPRRAISRTGFKLKGTGWYVTDYKSSGESKSNGGSGSEDSGSSSDSGGDSSSDDSDPDPAPRDAA